MSPEDREIISEKLAVIEKMANEIGELKDRIRFLEEEQSGDRDFSVPPRWAIYEHNSDWSSGGDTHGHFFTYAEADAVRKWEGLDPRYAAVVLYDPVKHVTTYDVDRPDRSW